MSLLESTIENPFYVIVHVRDAARDKIHRKKGSFRRVLEEIELIKRNYEYAEIQGCPTEIPEKLPKERPILVCGFFRDQCVTDQTKTLLINGYNAKISRLGVYPRN